MIKGDEFMDLFLFIVFMMVLLLSIKGMFSLIKAFYRGAIINRNYEYFQFFKYGLAIMTSYRLVSHFVFIDFSSDSFFDYGVNYILLFLFSISQIVDKYLRKKFGVTN